MPMVSSDLRVHPDSQVGFGSTSLTAYGIVGNRALESSCDIWGCGTDVDEPRDQKVSMSNRILIYIDR